MLWHVCRTRPRVGLQPARQRGGEVVVQLLNCVASWTEKLTFQKLLSPLSLCSAVTHVHLRLCFHFFYFFTEYTCQVPTKFTFKYQNV